MQAHNWTAIGNPGQQPGARVGRRGLISPRGASWALDAWLLPDSGELLRAEDQPAHHIRQRLQDRLPVVATAFEERTLRLATEAWCFTTADREWLAVQAVVFNLSDDPAIGHFLFALRPTTPDGSGEIKSLAWADEGFLIDGRPAVRLAAPPDAGWDCRAANEPPALTLPLQGSAAVSNANGRCLGFAAYSYDIEPWEEAEFIAYLPLGATEAENWPALPVQSYGLLKGAATRRWQEILAADAPLRLPDERLEEAWDANRAHARVLSGAVDLPDVVPPISLAYGDMWNVAAECAAISALVRQGSAEAEARLTQMMRLAGPTYAWPEYIDPQTGAGGGDGHSLAATLAWLELLREIAAR